MKGVWDIAARALGPWLNMDCMVPCSASAVCNGVCKMRLRDTRQATALSQCSQRRAHGPGIRPRRPCLMREDTMTKPFDLVVHGATGFTGRLVVEYLLQRHPAGGGLRWAMGGRSAAKLAAVRDELGAPADTPLVVTDTTHPASLQALMDSTRLVLTTVGPYQLYGNELVAACAKAGVDYV